MVVGRTCSGGDKCGGWDGDWLLLLIGVDWWWTSAIVNASDRDGARLSNFHRLVCDCFGDCSVKAFTDGGALESWSVSWKLRS